jgi:hypothetical protein
MSCVICIAKNGMFGTSRINIVSRPFRAFTRAGTRGIRVLKPLGPRLVT